MKDDIVIVSAARTPVGAFNGAFGSLPAHELGKVAIQAALKRAGVEGGAGLRGHPGPDPDRRPGPEPGAPGLDRRRHPGREPGLGRQPALRLGPARGRARLSGDPQRRHRDRGRRRPGVDEPWRRTAASAQRREDGRLRDGRHHDQGRPVGCLQRLSHGQHRRERRQAVADHPRSSRTSSRSTSQNKAEAAQKAGKFKDEIVAGHDQAPQGRHRRRHRRISEGRRHARRDRQAAPGLRQGRHGDRRQRLRHQ